MRRLRFIGRRHARSRSKGPWHPQRRLQDRADRRGQFYVHRLSGTQAVARHPPTRNRTPPHHHRLRRRAKRRIVEQRHRHLKPARRFEHLLRSNRILRIRAQRALDAPKPRQTPDCRPEAHPQRILLGLPDRDQRNRDCPFCWRRLHRRRRRRLRRHCSRRSCHGSRSRHGLRGRRLPRLHVHLRKPHQFEDHVREHAHVLLEHVMSLDRPEPLLIVERLRRLRRRVLQTPRAKACSHAPEAIIRQGHPRRREPPGI